MGFDMFVKWTLNETYSSRGGGVRGSSPRNLLASGVANGTFRCHSGSLYCTPIPLPPPLQEKFTLITRMVQRVGKKSEIRLKFENFDP